MRSSYWLLKWSSSAACHASNSSSCVRRLSICSWTHTGHATRQPQQRPAALNLLLDTHGARNTSTTAGDTHGARNTSTTGAYDSSQSAPGHTRGTQHVNHRSVRRLSICSWPHGARNTSTTAASGGSQSAPGHTRGTQHVNHRRRHATRQPQQAAQTGHEVTGKHGAGTKIHVKH